MGNWLFQNSVLVGIIYQCPKSGGVAVYGARALYATVNDKVLYDDVAECNAQNISWRTAQLPAEKAEGIKIYPNPTTSEVNILFTAPYQNAEIVLYSVLGKVVKTEKLPVGKTSHTLMGLESLAKGIYYLQVRNVPSQTFKLIIE